MSENDRNMSYEEWITLNVPKKSSEVYGNCKMWANKMQDKFPELTIVWGFYHCQCWGKIEHWWLKDKQDTIIDPTEHQFPGFGRGYYIEWIEH